MTRQFHQPKPDPQAQQAQHQQHQQQLVATQVSLSERAETIRQLATEIPPDQYGFPQYIFRPDLIPLDILSPAMPAAEKHGHLDNASVRISYDEGFPTIGTEPFWGQLPWEPVFAFQKFVEYLEQPTNDRTPIRSLSILAVDTGAPIEDLTTWFHLFWWRARAKAFDMFEIACHRRMNQRRMMRMDRSQFDHAVEFITMSADYLRKAFADPETYGLRPGDAIRLMDQMMRAQRVAAGGPANGGLGAVSGGAGGGRGGVPVQMGTSVEVLLKQASEGASTGGQT
jgi:hypothetical protein